LVTLTLVMESGLLLEEGEPWTVNSTLKRTIPGV